MELTHSLHRPDESDCSTLDLAPGEVRKEFDFLTAKALLSQNLTSILRNKDHNCLGTHRDGLNVTVQVFRFENETAATDQSSGMNDGMPVQPAYSSDFKIAIDLPDGIDINTCDDEDLNVLQACLLYTSPSPRDLSTSRMPSSA